MTRRHPRQGQMNVRVNSRYKPNPGLSVTPWSGVGVVVVPLIMRIRTRIRKIIITTTIIMIMLIIIIIVSRMIIIIVTMISIISMC